MSENEVFSVKNEVYYNLRYNIFRGTNVELMKWKHRVKPDDQSILSVIENANNAVRDAYSTNLWITIHQGNDAY